MATRIEVLRIEVESRRQLRSENWGRVKTRIEVRELRSSQNEIWGPTLTKTMDVMWRIKKGDEARQSLIQPAKTKIKFCQCPPRLQAFYTLKLQKPDPHPPPIIPFLTDLIRAELGTPRWPLKPNNLSLPRRRHYKIRTFSNSTPPTIDRLEDLISTNDRTGRNLITGWQPSSRSMNDRAEDHQLELER